MSITLLHIRHCYTHIHNDFLCGLGVTSPNQNTFLLQGISRAVYAAFCFLTLYPMKSWPFCYVKLCISIGFEGICYHHSHNTNVSEVLTNTVFKIPWFQRNLSPSSGWHRFGSTCCLHQDFFLRWRLYVLRNLSAKLHGVTSQNYIVALLFNAMRTSHSIFRSCSSVRTRNRVPRPYVTNLYLCMFRFKPYSRVVAYISPVLMDRIFRYCGQISSYGMRQICSYFVLSVQRVMFHTKAILLNATNRLCVQNFIPSTARDSCTTRFKNISFNCEW